MSDCDGAVCVLCHQQGHRAEQISVTSFLEQGMARVAMSRSQFHSEARVLVANLTKEPRKPLLLEIAHSMTVEAHGTFRGTADSQRRSASRNLPNRPLDGRRAIR